MMAVARSGRAESSVIVPVAEGAKVIVSCAGSALASSIAARSEPLPSSFALVTVMVLSTTRPSSVSTPGTRTLRGRLAAAHRGHTADRPRTPSDPE